MGDDEVVPVGAEDLSVDWIAEAKGENMARRIVPMECMQWPLSIWFTLGVQHGYGGTRL